MAPGTTAPVASSSTPTPSGGGGGGIVVDIYKTLPKAYQKTLAGLLPPTLYTSPPPVPDTLEIPAGTWSSRVAYKNLLLGGDPPQTISPLVVGKKRNRGYPEARAAAAREAKGKERAREEEGIVGERKRRRVGRAAGDGELSIPGTGITYAAILPLHHLHNVYLSQLLSLPPLPPPSSSGVLSPPPLSHAESIQSHLLKADFTGALLKVRASRNPSLRGLEGIVVEETASTFRLIGSDDKLRTIPKNGTQFRLSFPAYGPPSPKPPSTKDDPAITEDASVGVGIYLDPEEVDRWATTSPRIELDLMATAFGYRSGDRAGRKFRPAQGGGGGSGWGETWVRGAWSDVLGPMERDVGAGGVRGGENDGQGKTKRKRGKARRKDGVAWGRKDGIP